MKRSVLALSLLAGALGTSAANAAIYFTFDDPSTPLELTYVAGTGGGSGSVTYSSAARVDLVVDGTEDGFGITTYSARLTMDLAVAPVFAPPIPIAVTTGTFTFAIDDGFGGFTDILHGDAGEIGGAMFAIGFSGSISFSNDGDEDPVLFNWTAMNDLLAFLGGNQLIGAQSASFSLAALTPPVLGVNVEGYIPSFTANAAFVGHGEIPAPGPTALFGLAGLVMARRRR